MPFSMVPYVHAPSSRGGAGRVYLSEAVFRRALYAAVIGVPVCAVRLFTRSTIRFQSFCRLHRAVPFCCGALDSYVYDGGAGVFRWRWPSNLTPTIHFFFAGQIVFLFYTFFIELLTGEYRITPGRFGRLAFESCWAWRWAACSCGRLCCALKDNPRTVDLSRGFGFFAVRPACSSISPSWPRCSSRAD